MNLQRIIQEIGNFLEVVHYRGYDPYDGLTSPFTRGLPFPTLRFIVQQIIVRCPINLRNFLLVKPTLNPKALALILDAELNLYSHNPTDKRRKKIEHIISMLHHTAQKFNQGIGWGYPFPWQSSAFYLPANIPNGVVTAFVVKALSRAEELLFKDAFPQEIKEKIETFLLKGLRIQGAKEGIFWSYTPFDNTQVLNLNLLVAEALTHLPHPPLNLIEQAVSAVLYHQRSDGGFPYSLRKEWIDGFHTGFVLLSLKHLKRYVPSANDGLNRGWEFFKEKLLTPDGKPLFYPESLYPIDTHNISTGIILLLEMGEEGKAQTAVEFMIHKLYSNKGYFYYRYITPKACIKHPFIRWTTAWAYNALAKFWTKKTGG